MNTLNEESWSRLQIDFIEPLPRPPKGNKYRLVIIESFTKWVEVIPMMNYTELTTASVGKSSICTLGNDMLH